MYNECDSLPSRYKITLGAIIINQSIKAHFQISVKLTGNLNVIIRVMTLTLRKYAEVKIQSALENS